MEDTDNIHDEKIKKINFYDVDDVDDVDDNNLDDSGLYVSDLDDRGLDVSDLNSDLDVSDLNDLGGLSGINDSGAQSDTIGGAQSDVLIPVKSDNLSDWIGQSSNLRDKYNADLDILLELYDIVAQFIKRNKRILVGGMAIDYALRLKGSELYKVEKIDYDFISPDYHNDAYALGNEIAKKYSDVSVICAKHISTMRVRYKFIAVADITYAPPVVYDMIQTLNYEGFRIIHPWAQQVDQLRAMRNMLEGAPKESVLSDRIEKDTKRYRMLANAYPLDDVILPKLVTKQHKVTLSKDQVLYGTAAGIYWLKRFDMKLPANWDIKITKDTLNNTIITMPESSHLAWLVDKFPIDVVNNERTKKYNPMLDKLLPMYLLDSVEYVEGYGDKYIVEFDTVGYIDGIYSTMTWLATKWMFYSDDIAGYIYKQLQSVFCKDPTKFVPDFKNIFGSVVISSTQLMTQKRKENPEAAKLLLPRNAYPERGEHIKYDFDLTKSEVLQLDGKCINKVGVSPTTPDSEVGVYPTTPDSEVGVGDTPTSKKGGKTSKKNVKKIVKQAKEMVMSTGLESTSLKSTGLESASLKYVTGNLNQLKKYHDDIVRLYNVLRTFSNEVKTSLDITDIYNEEESLGVVTNWVLLILDNKVIAMCRYFPILDYFIKDHQLTNLDIHNLNELSQVATIIVDDKYRGKGYGSKLLDIVKHHGKDLILDTYADWSSAVALYTNNGFQKIKETDENGKKINVYLYKNSIVPALR